MFNRLIETVKAALPDQAKVRARRLVRYLTSLRFRGAAYQCPFCRGSFSEFLATGFDLPVLKEKQVVGAGYRAGAVCPRCLSKDRERLVYLYLKERQPEIFTQRVRLLHVAPEPSLSVMLRACATISYVSADFAAAAADVRMDITDILEADGSYDVIICNHVLEHVEQDGVAMRELFRILKPGGFAILQVPISFQMATTHEDFTIRDPRERERIFGQFDHVRIYGRDYPERLSAAGFWMEIVSSAEFLTPHLIDAYRLLPSEKLFVGRKR